jgi:hypothetical protein
MAKKRTGLQSEIAGIFSGVPVPKKGGPRSQPGSPAPKSDVPASKPSGSVFPKPVALQPQFPVAPTPIKPVEPLPAAPRPRVTEIKVPEQKVRQIPKKMPRRRKNKLFASKAGVSSSRQKASIILFVLFTSALVIVLARPYFTPRRNATTSRTAGQASDRTSPMANIEINWPMPPVYPANLRDPMELGTRQQIRIETPVNLVVKGITYSEDRKFAVIGTQLKQEGDTILGATIKKINPNNVVFERDGEIWTQEVEGEK